MRISREDRYGIAGAYVQQLNEEREPDYTGWPEDAPDHSKDIADMVARANDAAAAMADDTYEGAGFQHVSKSRNHNEYSYKGYRLVFDRDGEGGRWREEIYLVPPDGKVKYVKGDELDPKTLKARIDKEVGSPGDSEEQETFGDYAGDEEDEDENLVVAVDFGAGQDATVFMTGDKVTSVEPGEALKAYGLGNYDLAKASRVYKERIDRGEEKLRALRLALMQSSIRSPQ
tara:strand:+ start:1093 stop:1782 length:690 start_codon:yes stop_codon:yes gene_type:complete